MRKVNWKIFRTPVTNNLFFVISSKKFSCYVSGQLQHCSKIFQRKWHNEILVTKVRQLFSLFAKLETSIPLKIINRSPTNLTAYLDKRIASGLYKQFFSTEKVISYVFLIIFNVLNKWYHSIGSDLNDCPSMLYTYSCIVHFIQHLLINSRPHLLSRLLQRCYFFLTFSNFFLLYPFCRFFDILREVFLTSLG